MQRREWCGYWIAWSAPSVFTRCSLSFGSSSKQSAFRAHDRAAVMKALGSTLQTCTACHSTFRQSVVDEATWNRLTSLPAPSGHLPHAP